ncbi:MAG: AAA family ATPase [Bacteroidetes bacterium]|nr:AAA family ATPase [Bacteroidota bacterium]
MKDLPSDAIVLKENSFWSVYRWKSSESAHEVVLKLLNPTSVRNGHLKQLTDEFHITRQLDLPFVRKALEKLKLNNREGLLLQYVPGNTLKEWIKKNGGLDINQFLELTIRIADQLFQIHEKGYYHRDINPENIIVNESLTAITFIDFDLATPFGVLREQPLKESLEGTLAYLSPEQTGRTNRKIDYRTDLYSLGITFYECITGQLPFSFSDPTEMIHAHLAIEPKSVHEIKSEIPMMISLIIKKMMAKNAEMRYQSLEGVKHDLVKCKTLLQQVGSINEFQLAERDHFGRFNIPHLLLGREQETALLRKMLERVIQSSSCEILIITGEAGSGKSTLAAHLHPYLLEQHGYFVSGKYDVPQLSSPYSAIISAFKGLTNILLSEPEESILEWKEILNRAVGDSGNVLTEVIPELQLILGPQPQLTQLGSREAGFRFNYVFTNFIKAISAKHPLVIFLDDLQWADEASLILIKAILTEKELGKVFLIATCREEERAANTQLVAILNDIEKNKPIEYLLLEPLPLQVIQQIVLETINCTRDQAIALAKAIQRKTLGNAFFVNQFLKSLYERNYLRWQNALGWTWDEGEIENLNITDNVVELLCQSIRKMEPTTQQALMVASCIGRDFSVSQLASVLENNDQVILAFLQDAIKNGLITYSAIGRVAQQNESQKFRFTHDRIQQASYSLLDDAQKQQWHYKIAMNLVQFQAEDTDHYLFEIVNHFRLCKALIREDKLKQQVARFNLDAGLRAKRSVAFPQAHVYFQDALFWLQPFKPWTTDYEVTLQLLNEIADTSYLIGNYERMEYAVGEILQNATSLLHKIKAYEVKIQYYQSRNKLVEAVELAVDVAAMLGVRFPSNPSRINILTSLVSLQFSLTRKNHDTLVQLPHMANEKILAAMRILVSVNSAAYFAIPNLFPLLVFKQVELSLKYGNCEFSPFAYASFGVVKTGVLGDIEGGYKLGQVAEKLLDQFPSKSLRIRTMIVINGFLNHWKVHPSHFVLALPAYFDAAKESGDIEYAALCLFNQTLYSFCLGQSLLRLEQEATQRDEIIQAYNQNTPLFFNKIFLQTVINLRGGAVNPTELIGRGYDESVMIEIHQQANDKTSLFACYMQKAYLHFLFYQYDHALTYITKTEQYLESAIASVIYPVYFFYEGLIYVAQAKSQAASGVVLKKVRKNLRKLEKWAEISPEHHGHRHQLLLAEYYRMLGKKQEAASCYEEAARRAIENQFTQEAALSYELAGKFYLEQGRESLAVYYLESAVRAYAQWGAIEKVKHLTAQYGKLLRYRRVEEFTVFEANDSLRLNNSQALDLNTVVKANQAISQELVLGALLEKMMVIVEQSAGAQRGALIDNDNNQLKVLVDRHSMMHSPLDAAKDLPLSVIHYVARTKKSLVFGNAYKDLQFGNDEYIIREQPKSILCYPVIRKGKLSCIFYLENNLAYDTFTAQRLELLDILAPQMAISIENALLYENLEAKVKMRTEEIQVKNEKLEQQKEEIGYQRDRLEEAQKEIIFKNEELRKVNSNLEVIVEDRTRELMVTLEKLKESNKELDTFIYRASHDLKGPILRIQGLTMITQREPDPGLQKLNINRIEFTAIEMGRVLSKLLNIHQVFKDEIEKTKVNFEQLISDVAKTLQPLIWENTDFLQVDIPADVVFHSDIQFLKTILENLIENSIVFRKEEIELKIKVAISAKEGKLIMAVRDNGSGIDPEIKNQLFNMFYRGSEKSIGNGLGLYLVKKATEKLGGEVHIESEQYEFTEVTVVIPSA